MRSGIRVTLDNVRLTEYDANGFLGIQIDAFGEESSGMADIESVGLYGLFSRPLDPEVDESGTVRFGAMALTLWEGSDAQAIPLYDARGIPGLATLQKGETVLYGSGANFVRCHADGRISRFTTTDATINGQTLFDELGPAGYTLKTPWSLLRNDATGFHYECGASTLDMGQISGLPAPFSAFSSYFDLQAHTVRVLGSAVQLGVGAGALPIARAAPIVTALTATSAALSAIAAIPSMSGAAVAIGAAVAAITAALATIPSNSTTAT